MKLKIKRIIKGSIIKKVRSMDLRQVHRSGTLAMLVSFLLVRGKRLFKNQENTDNRLFVK